MKPFMKTAVGIGLAGALALTSATPSLARSRHWVGPAVGAGIVAGAILGTAAAAASAPYYYDNGPYAYDGYDSYAAGPGYNSAYDNYAYAPRYSYRGYTNNAPHRENQLTGQDAGFIHNYNNYNGW